MPESTPDLLEMIAKDNEETAQAAAAKVKPKAEPKEAEEEAEPEPEAESEETAAETEGDTEQADSEEEATEEAEEEEATPSTLKRAKEVLGEEAAEWLTTFQNDEALIRSAWEATKLVGKRNQATEFVKQLQQAGITDDDIVDLLSRKAGGTDKKVASEEEWNPAWVTVDEKGDWIPTARGRTEPNIDAKIKRYRLQLSEAMTDPAKLAAFLRPHLTPDIDAKTQEAREEAKRDAELRENRRLMQLWEEKNKNLLVVEETGQATALRSRVQQYLESGEHPDWGTLDRRKPWDEQAAVAMRWAIADTQKTTKSKTVVPAKAKHSPPRAPGTPHTISDEEFFKKYGTHDLEAFARFKDTGELPKR